MTRFAVTLAVMFSLGGAPLWAQNRVAITASNGLEMTETSDGFRVGWSHEDSWRFNSRSFEIAIEAFRMGDAPVARTEEMVEVNTWISFFTSIDGARHKIACRGAAETGPEGWVERTALSETSVSATFTMTFTRCRDFYSSTPVDYDGLPLVVEGAIETLLK